MATKLPYNGVPAARAPQNGEAPALVRQAREAKLRGASGERSDYGANLIRRRHPDWTENQIFWLRMLDALEGGERYRNAVYGPDRFGLPLRNLLRHKREYPDPQLYGNNLQGLGAAPASAAGTGFSQMMGPFPGMVGADPSATAQDDEYEYRRSRTPVPEFVREVAEVHLGKIFEQEISRKAPPEVERWWANADGGGTPIDEWVRDEIAPVLLALGTLDVVLDRPMLPEWIRVETRADEIANNLDTVVAAYILPQNMLWWTTDAAGNYTECLVREFGSPTLADPADDESVQPTLDNAMAGVAFPGQIQPSDVRYRHWTSTTVTLYDADGEVKEPTREHGYPFVPIVRLRDKVRHRQPMVGKSRYEFIAACQREYYNRDSELILSDTIQACPLLSGPEECCKPDSEISIGPSFILPMKRVSVDGGYQGWEYVSPPKDPAREIRENMKVILDAKDRAAGLIKPAGVTGTTGGTVSQSGYSKAMDADNGNKILGDISRTLARVERRLAEFCLMCVRRAPIADAERAAIAVVYPSRFQLKQPQEILGELASLVNILAIEQEVADPALAGKAAATPKAPAPAGATPDDQRGGNTPKADPGPRSSGVQFLCPTLIAETIAAYARAALGSAPEKVFDQIDRELAAFYDLHAVPRLGTASDREAMDGRGTEESTAGQDPLGQSAATSVSPMMPLID